MSPRTTAATKQAFLTGLEEAARGLPTYRLTGQCTMRSTRDPKPRLVIEVVPTLAPKRGRK